MSESFSASMAVECRGFAFYGMNGFRLTFTNDEAYDLVIAVAAGELDDVSAIAERLAVRSEPRA